MKSSVNFFCLGDLLDKISRSQYVSNLRNKKDVLEDKIIGLGKLTKLQNESFAHV